MGHAVFAYLSVSFGEEHLKLSLNFQISRKVSERSIFMKVGRKSKLCHGEFLLVTLCPVFRGTIGKGPT